MSESCGCLAYCGADHDADGDVTVDYCPLHTAVPDLLAALERFAFPVHITQPCPYCRDGHTRTLLPTDDDLAVARAAIAKAKGEDHAEH